MTEKNGRRSLSPTEKHYYVYHVYEAAIDHDNLFMIMLIYYIAMLQSCNVLYYK